MSKTKTMIVDPPEEFQGLCKPGAILLAWLDEAKNTSLREPTAMTLSTIDAGGAPQSRVVLCKEVEDDSVYFFTNYNSNKGLEIQNSEKVSLNFFWDPLGRQVRITGHARKTSRQRSEDYWATRARGSQLSGFASQQSKEVDSRDKMLAKLAQVEREFEGKAVPCPMHWGGYKVEALAYEFWIGRADRFHDRLRFTKVGDDWVAQRLYP